MDITRRSICIIHLSCFEHVPDVAGFTSLSDNSVMVPTDQLGVFVVCFYYFLLVSIFKFLYIINQMSVDVEINTGTC